MNKIEFIVSGNTLEEQVANLVKSITAIYFENELFARAIDEIAYDINYANQDIYEDDDWEDDDYSDIDDYENDPDFWYRDNDENTKPFQI